MEFSFCIFHVFILSKKLLLFSIILFTVKKKLDVIGVNSLWGKVIFIKGIN